MIGVWIAGAPGVGKSTAARNMVQMGRIVSIFVDQRWTLVQYTHPQVSLMFSGLYRGKAFDGGDTMSVQDARRALDFVKSLPPRWKPDALILEGARFCYRSVFDAIEEQLTPHVIYLEADSAELTRRRKKRKKEWSLKGGVDTKFQESMLRQANRVYMAADPYNKIMISSNMPSYVGVRSFEEICLWISREQD